MASAAVRSSRALVSWFVLLAALGACAEAGESPSSISSTPSPVSAVRPSSPSISPAAFPVTLRDETGRDVTLTDAPQRIVSLAPSNTEIVCALDACDALVGVTDYDDYPAEVAAVEDVVIQAQVDVEKVVAADPDLVLAAGNELTSSAVIDQLGELGLTVMVLYPESLDEVYDDIELVGRALGRAEQAVALTDELRRRASDVRDAVASAERPRTFYEVSVFEGIIYTAGEDSFLAAMIEAAGGEPVAGEARSTAIALEDLVAADPQLIVLGDAAYDPSVNPAVVAARPGWAEISAVRDGRVVPFEDDVLVTRPGPRIVDGLEALARAIHPDLVD